MIEELEPRNAPGSLLGVAGQTAPSPTGSGAPANAAVTRTTAVPAPTAVVTNASASSAAAPRPAATSATQGSSGGARGLAPSSTGNSFAPFDLFVDDNAASGAAAPVPAPTSADPSTPAPTPGVQNFASSLPSADQSFPAASSDPVTGPSDLPPTRAPQPTVTLTAPEFVNFHGSPLLVVKATPAPGGNALDPTVHIDVDLKHDGSFADAGDADFAVGTAGLNHTAAITLTRPLSEGTYALRARVADTQGHVTVSATATMIVDPYSGFVGSEPLLDLAYGLPYGTPVTPAGLPSSGGPSATTAPKPQDFSILEFDPQSRVLVNVHSTLAKYLGGLTSDLQSKLGFTPTGTYPSQNMVTGWLPITQIVNLPNLDHFDSVTPVYKPKTDGLLLPKLGSYPTDADPVIHSDAFRTANGVDGTGVKVGVISDSVNESSGGLAASVATGDLPANVQVLQDDLAGNGSDEGRAMLEIVHHIAPGASLAFNSGANGAQSFAAAITNLAGAGAKVETDDLGYLNEPVFNDGVIAKAAEAVSAAGVFYTSAAGNDADHAYLAAYKGITATVGGITGQFQDITGAGSPLQTFSIGVGVTTTISFTWDAAYLEGGGTGNYVVPNNFIAQVTDASGNALATPQVFDAMAQNTNEADDIIQFTNDGSFGTNNFAFSFNLASGPAPTMVYWQSFDDGGPGDPKALNEGAPTAVGHVDAVGVVSTGAVHYTTPTVVEPFSALGGAIPILFDANGARLATPDVRNVPTVAAPDGVHTSFFAQPDGAGGFVFFGTSAATPHVAAAAALLLQQAPAATNTQVTQYLVANAQSLNDPTHAGAGLIQLAGPLAVPTPTPTPTTGTPVSFNPETEVNQTSDTALYLGTLTVGNPANISNLDLAPLPDGRNDYDWFSFTMGQAGALVVTEGTAAGGNVELQLFTLEAGGVLVELAKTVTPGVNSSSLGAVVGAGQEILVEVKGQNTSSGRQDSASYQLSATLT